MPLSVKSRLRRAARQIRAAIPPAAARRAAAALPAYLPDLLAFCAGFSRCPAAELQNFALYYPHGSELDCLPLLRALRAAGKRSLLPAFTKQGSMIFRLYAADAPLQSGAFGLTEPAERAPALAPDAILLPLLAFNATGGRLGQGGGYYDKAIAALQAQGRRPPLIGLGYSAQQLPPWPAEPHDAPLDAALTEKGLRLFAPAD